MTTNKNNGNGLLISLAFAEDVQSDTHVILNAESAMFASPESDLVRYVVSVVPHPVYEDEVIIQTAHAHDTGEGPYVTRRYSRLRPVATVTVDLD